MVKMSALSYCFTQCNWGEDQVPGVTKRLMQIFRNRRGWRLFCLLLLAGATPAVPAAEDSLNNLKQGGFWSIQFENDLWGSGDDRFYSHGTEISYLSLKQPPGWLSGMGDALPFFKRGDVTAVQYAVGQKIFTPEDTESRNLILNDRPYAGWLYGSANLMSRYVDQPNLQVGNILGITVGIVGPSSQGDSIQKGFHDLIGVDKPNGWDNQLEDEPGVLLTYTRRWQYFHNLGSGVAFETAPHLVGALGNIYTYAGGGMMFRLGKGLRNDIAPPNIRPGFPGVPFVRPSDRVNWYFFAGMEGRAMARNIFLDGNTFKDSHSVDKKTFVADAQFGFAIHYQNIRFALSNVWRSREFEEQDDNVQFGAINLSFFVPF